MLCPEKGRISTGKRGGPTRTCTRGFVAPPCYPVGKPPLIALRVLREAAILLHVHRTPCSIILRLNFRVIVHTNGRIIREVLSGTRKQILAAGRVQGRPRDGCPRVLSGKKARVTYFARATFVPFLTPYNLVISETCWNACQNPRVLSAKMFNAPPLTPRNKNIPKSICLAHTIR